MLKTSDHTLEKCTFVLVQLLLFDNAIVLYMYANRKASSSELDFMIGRIGPNACWAATDNIKIMVENGRDISRSVSPRFLHLTWSYSYFRTKTESVRKTGHEIRNRDEIGLGPIPIVFAYPVFISGYPVSAKQTFWIYFLPSLTRAASGPAQQR